MHLHSADTTPQSPHRTTAAITADFAATWPAVETPLRRYLGSIGVSRHDIDDLVQETASRAIGFKVPYNDAGDLRAWSFVVARRLLANLHRSRRRQVALDGTQRPDPRQDDLMAQVEDRLIVEQVLAASAELTVAERRHLGVRSSGTTAERNRANVSRHRARQHLRKLVGPLLTTTAVLLRRRTKLATATLGVAAAALPFALLPAHSGIGAGSPAPHPTVTQTTAVTSMISEGAPPPVVAARRQRPTAATDSGAHATPKPPVLSWRTVGPANSNAHASVEENDGKQPLVCTTGTIIDRRCLTLPPGIGLKL